eukprot:9489158-Pyramimonas_sp.AAC.1
MLGYDAPLFEVLFEVKSGDESKCRTMAKSKSASSVSDNMLTAGEPRAQAKYSFYHTTSYYLGTT